MLSSALIFAAFPHLQTRQQTGQEAYAVTGVAMVGSIWSVALSPDARRLMTASEDFTARVWDVLSGNCAHVLEGHTGWVVHIAATDDGQHCATASHDGTARSARPYSIDNSLV